MSEAPVAVPRERRATWFELLFDLVFVAAVGQVAHRVVAHPTALELLVTAALFVPLWWMWVIYTYQANRFDPGERGPHRLVALAGMFGMCLVAVALPGVGSHGSDDLTFVAGYLLARAIPAVLYVLAGRTEPTALPIARRYATGSAIAAVGWIGGLFLPGAWQVVAWVLAMAVELALPFTAARPTNAVTHSVEHLKERFGLFTIIVIGEAILAVVAGLSGTSLDAAGGLTAVFAFVLAAGMWWIYFNTGSLREGAHDSILSRQWLRHVFTYGHLPAQLGLALAGAGVSVAILDAPRALPGAIAGALFGGTGLYLLAILAVRVAFQHRLTRTTVIRGIAGLLALALLWPATVIPAQVGVGLLALLVVGVAFAETRLAS